MAGEKPEPFAHLSNDLGAETVELTPTPDELAPDIPPEEMPTHAAHVHEMPTQIIRAHKVLERARTKRKQREEEGRTLVIDRDRPPPSPPKKPPVWYLLLALSVLGLCSGAAMLVWHLTTEDVMEEAIAEELDTHPLPARDPPAQIAPRIAPPPAATATRAEVAPPPEPTVRKARKRRGDVRARPAEEDPIAPSLPADPPLEIEIPPEPQPQTPRVAPERPPEGALVITSGFLGAKVEIDNRAVGEIPIDRVALPPGRHSIWVTLKGYEVFQKDVLIKAGQIHELEIKLKPIPPP